MHCWESWKTEILLFKRWPIEEADGIGFKNTVFFSQFCIYNQEGAFTPPHRWEGEGFPFNGRSVGLYRDCELR